jgi:hypothetical protein
MYLKTFLGNRIINFKEMNTMIKGSLIESAKISKKAVKANHSIYNLLGIRYGVNDISKVPNCAKFEGRHLSKSKLQGIFANLNINSLLQQYGKERKKFLKNYIKQENLPQRTRSSQSRNFEGKGK